MTDAPSDPAARSSTSVRATLSRLAGARAAAAERAPQRSAPLVAPTSPPRARQMAEQGEAALPATPKEVFGALIAAIKKAETGAARATRSSS